MGFDIPAPPRGLRWGFAKVARKSGAFAQSIAMVTAAGKDGPIRAVLGGAGSRPRALVATMSLLQLPDGTEEQLRAAIGSDLVTFFPGQDAYQTRMHTANPRAVREMWPTDSRHRRAHGVKIADASRGSRWPTSCATAAG
jgi:carbon-monoxide dehydrogenase medium subunit